MALPVSGHRSSETISFTVRDGVLDLGAVAPGAGLWDLAVGIERIHYGADLCARGCRGCAACCSDLITVLAFDLPILGRALSVDTESLIAGYLRLPPRPDRDKRQRGIRDLTRQFEIAEPEAARIYDFNQADAITVRIKKGRECLFLEDGLCSIYPCRPLACRLYVCHTGDELTVLHEAVVTQGTWHFYAALGWLPEEDLSYNPFVGAENYAEVALADFLVSGDDPPEKFFLV